MKSTKRSAITDVGRLKCGWKRRFESERIANTRAAEPGKNTGATLHTYRCRHCKGWHLTSLPPKRPNTPKRNEAHGR